MKIQNKQIGPIKVKLPADDRCVDVHLHNLTDEPIIVEPPDYVLAPHDAVTMEPIRHIVIEKLGKDVNIRWAIDWRTKKRV